MSGPSDPQTFSVAHFKQLQNEIKELRSDITCLKDANAKQLNMFSEQKQELISSKGDKEQQQKIIRELQDEVKRLGDRIKPSETAKPGSEDTKSSSVIDKIERNTDINTKLTKALGKLKLHETILNDFDFNFQFLENISYDGTLVWKINNVNGHMEKAKSGETLSLFSQPFYTGVRGYKMCGRVFLNGDGEGKGTHLSFYFVLMKGTYDDLLQWPFQSTIQLGIISINADNTKRIIHKINSDSESSSFKRSVAEMNIGSGCAKFLAHSELFSGPFMKEDRIYLTIDVKDRRE